MGFLELALAFGNQAIVRRIIEPYPATGVLTSGTVGGFFALGLVPRLLGDAALLLGEIDAVRVRYAEALSVAEGMQHRPEQALSMLGLACSLARSPARRNEAKRLLDTSIGWLRAMKMRPALQRALRLREELSVAKAHGGARPGSLCARELEVLRLIALGKSSREIADELVFSFHTVNRHVANILSKTGTATRGEAIAFAARRGLIGARDVAARF